MTVTVLIRRNEYTDWLEAFVEQGGQRSVNLLGARKCSSISEAKQRVRAELTRAIAAGVEIVWDIKD